MRVFVVFVTPDDTGPEVDSGFVRADTAEEALELVGRPDASGIHLPADAEWPGEPEEQICRGP